MNAASAACAPHAADVRAVQIGGDGHLRHLLTLAGLDRAALLALLDRAADLRRQWRESPRALPRLDGSTIVNLFFEPSTRTRTSFELAARRLGAVVVNFDVAASSTNKGETLEDTLATLEAMDARAFVVRHHESGAPARVAAQLRHAAVINAGDGAHAHPTQGLLDALTIRDRCRRFERLKVTICGDIRHSRVARSDVDALVTLGVGDIRLCAPAPLLPPTGTFGGCVIETDFDAAIEGADVVVMLRLQRERMRDLAIAEHAYFTDYGLSAARLKRAADDAIVLHPGPINRGVEIASDVADGAQSVILEQVANGVFVRMAALLALLGPR